MNMQLADQFGVLCEHFPNELAEIVYGYAPYWMNVGKTTFVQSLNKIHPDNIRDIWADSIALDDSSVVEELLDYYDDLIDIEDVASYSYIPPNMDMSVHQPTRKRTMFQMIYNQLYQFD